MKSSSLLVDLLLHMTETACVRAWEDEGWGPYHKRLLTMTLKLENPGFKKGKDPMSPVNVIENHLRKVKTISIREAMADYGLSGGHLTKIISRLKRERQLDIETRFYKHPITGRRYARYFLKAAA